MKKIKKVDPRLGQSVMAFGCPCGTCALSNCGSECEANGNRVGNKATQMNTANRKYGGSLVGGG